MAFRYEKWKDATKSNFVEGAMEEQSTMQKFGDKGTVRIAKHKFHMKNEMPKAPDRFRDDFHTKRKRINERIERGDVPDINPNKIGLGLRTPGQIAKERLRLEKEKLRNLGNKVRYKDSEYHKTIYRSYDPKRAAREQGKV